MVTPFSAKIHLQYIHLNKLLHIDTCLRMYVHMTISQYYLNSGCRSMLLNVLLRLYAEIFVRTFTLLDQSEMSIRHR